MQHVSYNSSARYRRVNRNNRESHIQIFRMQTWEKLERIHIRFLCKYFFLRIDTSDIWLMKLGNFYRETMVQRGDIEK